MTEMVQITVYTSPELKQQLEQAADEKVVSVSLLARTAIEHYLDNLEDPMRMLRQTATFEKPSIWRRLFPFSSAMADAWRDRLWE